MPGSAHPFCGSWLQAAPPAPQLRCWQPSPSRPGLWQQRAARDREDRFNKLGQVPLSDIYPSHTVAAKIASGSSVCSPVSGLGCCACIWAHPRQGNALRRATASRNMASYGPASPSGLGRESCWFRRICPVTRALYGILSCLCWKAIKIRS